MTMFASGPYPLVTAYTTVELLFASFGPPAANRVHEIHFIASAHASSQGVEVIAELRGRTAVVPILHTRQVPTSISAGFCGSRM